MGITKPTIVTPLQTPVEGNRDVNLCAGAGGLAIGLTQAGFSPTHLFELSSDACKTLRDNIAAKTSTLSGAVFEGDIREVDWTPLRGHVRLLAGGVPCQPFSLGGKHQAEKDNRNLFPQLLRAVRTVQPQAVLVENVRGFFRDSFQPYFEYLLRQLQIPSFQPKDNESWKTHDNRIRRYLRSFYHTPEYQVSWRLLDSADFGVPQVRHRVFIVATRMELPPYRFPDTTHSRDALVRIQNDGQYWRDRDLRKPRVNYSNGYIPKVDNKLPWVTVRDSLKSLAKPSMREQDSRLNHWRIPGARVYEGHDGSSLDWPSKTIKAGVHGVPGGENMVLDDRRRIRYYTLRETARLQTFPDSHEFQGTRRQITSQIGNAVPCALATAIARPLFHLLVGHAGVGQIKEVKEVSGSGENQAPEPSSTGSKS